MRPGRAIWWGLGVLFLAALAAGRRYVFPVPGGRVADTFGPRVHPITGELKDHNGVDIAAPVGTPVLAPAAGVVKSRYWHELGGLSLVLTLDDEYATRAGFAHLHTQDVREGDRVYAGQQIGTVGATGAVTGPHLHFTLSRDGVFIDPLTLVAA